MRRLSRSNLVAFRQCKKRLWLQVNRAELTNNPPASSVIEVGNEVGLFARIFYDTEKSGVLVADPGAPARTAALLSTFQPIFEADFSNDEVSTRVDIVLPEASDTQLSWKIIEVKSSTSVKEYHLDEAAILSFVARSLGVSVSSLALSHIDKNFVYQGGGQYRGLFTEVDVTAGSADRASQVSKWIAGAARLTASSREPKVRTGGHCSKPFECEFFSYCDSKEPKAKFPASVLPQVRSKALKALIEGGVGDLRMIPDKLLTDRQRRVKECTLTGKVYFDSKSASQDLAQHKFPAYFIDFETTQFAVPIWVGTRPYQQIPFQFSVHRLTKSGDLEHFAFLDLTGDDPSLRFAQELLDRCGSKGPVFVYNAAFEVTRLKELATRFEKLKARLNSLSRRTVDLLKVAQDHYYHPSQEGSWSIKSLLPSIAPDLSYEKLDGIRDGGMAAIAYRQAISPSTTPEDKSRIRNQLLEYCKLDTLAMVRAWEFFSGGKRQNARK